MKQTYLYGVAMLALFIMTTSGKVKKTVAVGKEDCKGFGLKCTPDKGSISTATFIYDEPHKGSFRMQFGIDDVSKNSHLLTSFRNGISLILDEDMPIPDDVVAALHMPRGFEVAKGDYPFFKDDENFTIIFQE
jgi:hypothetical protein